MKIYIHSVLLAFLFTVIGGGALVKGEDRTAPLGGVPSLLGVPGLSDLSGDTDKIKEIHSLWEEGHKRKAKKELKKWVDLDKKSPTPFVVWAALYFQDGKYKKTLSYGKKALKKSPQNAEAYFWRGRAYEMLGKPLEAANEYRAALFARKGFSAAQAGLDRSLAQLKGK